MTARYIIGDTRDVVRSLADNSVDLICTSPPFLALRSYLPAEHPQKHREIGSEATPADFLDVLLDLTEEWSRVLAPHGSIVVELGDTYAGSGGSGGDYGPDGMRDGQPSFSGSAARSKNGDREYRQTKDERTVDATGIPPIRGFNGIIREGKGGRGWPLDKSLCGIPHLFHLSLAYGRNLLRPERTTDPWRVRNVVAWCRPNPPVGALGDKYRPATSYMTVACKSRTRWFDLDAVREPLRRPEFAKYEPITNRVGPGRAEDGAKRSSRGSIEAGAPPLDWWNVPTEPYAGSHYATWPRKLLERPIASMCPQRVCRTCGQPSRRITEQTNEYAALRREGSVVAPPPSHVAVGNKAQGLVSRESGFTAQRTTVGWSDCGHDDWRTGVVLDPFAGSGTTLAVATGHGRDAIGIDLDERNADLALERVGPMFLTVERHDRSAA